MKNILKQISRHLKDADRVLLGLCILASSLSVFFLYFIHSTFPDMYGKRIFLMQLGASLIGIVLILGISFFDYRTMTKLWFVHMPICIILMLATFIWGVGRQGADDKAWLYILGISVQPAEFLKLSFILTFAAHLEAVEEKLNYFGFADGVYHVSSVPADLRIDHAFECVGGEASRYAVAQIIDMINPEGAIGLMGVSESFIGINTRMVLEKGLRIFGSSRSGVDDFQQTMDLLEENPRIAQYLENLIAGVVEIRTIPDIHSAFQQDISRNFGKTVLKWNK